LRVPLAFLVELGAAMMVASTIVPVPTLRPLARYYIDQANADKQIAQAKAEERRAMAVLLQQAVQGVGAQVGHFLFQRLVGGQRQQLAFVDDARHLDVGIHHGVGQQLRAPTHLGGGTEFLADVEHGLSRTGTEAAPGAPACTGAAAPMVPPGAIATVWADSAINAPTEMVRLSTKATVRSLLSSSESRIWTAASTRPPKVLMSSTTAAAPA